MSKKNRKNPKNHKNYDVILSGSEESEIFRVAQDDAKDVSASLNMT